MPLRICVLIHLLGCVHRSQPAFHAFVNAIRADGGGDTPEDIMGGLKAVFTNLSWRAGATKVQLVLHRHYRKTHT